MANGIVLGGKLKFRKKASTSGTVITSIPTGTVLSVSAVSGNDSWYQTTYSTYGTGYVMKSFVAVASDTVEVNATNVNVRNSANGSTVLYTLSSPATATVQDVSSDWVKIQPSGKKVGWIKADYVNKKSSGSSSGGNSSGSSSSDLIGKSGMVVVNENGLRVRSSANGSLLSYKLYNGEKVTILEVSTAGGYTWYRVQDSQNRTNGWVRSDFIAVDNASGGGSSSSSDLVGKSGMVAVNASGLNVRSSANGSLLSYKLYNGEKVTILEVSTAGGYTWYRVQDSQNRTNGWVRSDFIAVDNTSGGTEAKLVLGVEFTGTTTDEVTSYVTIRTSPRASSSDLHHLEAGEVKTFYTFTGVGTVDEQRQWLYMPHGGYSGYVCARYISGGGSSLDSNAYVSDSQGVYLRVLPSTSAAKIGLLPSNSHVIILDTSVANWYRVTSTKGTGWVSAAYLTLRKK